MKNKAKKLRNLHVNDDTDNDEIDTENVASGSGDGSPFMELFNVNENKNIDDLRFEKFMKVVKISKRNISDKSFPSSNNQFDQKYKNSEK